MYSVNAQSYFNDKNLKLQMSQRYMYMYMYIYVVYYRSNYIILITRLVMS